jgi:hypothetical protein
MLELALEGRDLKWLLMAVKDSERTTRSPVLASYARMAIEAAEDPWGRIEGRPECKMDGIGAVYGCNAQA